MNILNIRILLWTWNSLLAIQVVKRNGTCFMLLVNSRVETAVRGVKWRHSCGESCCLNVSLPTAFGGRVRVPRHHFVISSLVMEDRQGTHSESFTCVLCSLNTVERCWVMPEKTEGDHRLESDTCPENLEGEDGLTSCESSTILNSQSSRRPYCFLWTNWSTRRLRKLRQMIGCPSTKDKGIEETTCVSIC